MSHFQVLAKLNAKQNVLVFSFSTITLDSVSLRLHFHSNGTGCIGPDRDTAQELGTHGAAPGGSSLCCATRPAWLSGLCCAAQTPGLQDNPSQLAANSRACGQLPPGTSNYTTCTALLLSGRVARSSHANIP